MTGALAPTPKPISLGDIDLRDDDRTLAIAGRVVAIGGRAFDLLQTLLDHRGRTVGKDELIDRVWPNLVVEENNLQVQVSALRKVLGAQAILTIPGRGYKLVLAPGPAVEGQGQPSDGAPSNPVGVKAPTPSNLPASPAPLYGRSDDVTAIRALVKAHALVSVVGAGGIGKTRVAQAVADGGEALGPDGIWWVELASIADPSLVAATVARVVGATGSDERSPLQALLQRLAAQSTLIVLDNCEHLADAVVALVEAIVAAAPGVRLIVTSQEPLRSAHEQLYRLGPLATPAPGEPMPDALGGAAELFVERARSLDRRFALSASRWPAVAEICRRLDGIPLAIEMAAARLPLLGLEGVRQRLDERFKILTGNSRTVLRRHQTLRATLDWSYSLLSSEEQTVLRRLGVFAGTFSLGAAERVVGDDQMDSHAALDHLGALVDKSMVVVEGEDEPRYRLLETTRAYALERLGEANETGALLRRHADALLGLLTERDRLGPATGGAARAALAAELDNLRAALTWAGEDGAAGAAMSVEIASLSMPIWHCAVALHEGIETLLGIAPRIDARTPELVQARLWKAIARLGTVTARRECLEAARNAAAIYRRLGVVDSLYEVLISVVAIGSERGDSEEAGAALAEAASIEHAGLPRRLLGGMAWARQRWLNRADRIEEAMHAVLEQAEHYRAAGLEGFAAIAEGANVSVAEVELGRPRSAEARARQALAVLASLGAQRDGGHVRMALVLALCAQGRHDDAIDEACRALPLLQAEGDEFRMLEPLALNAALQGRATDAVRVLGYADRHRAANGAVRTPAQQRRRDKADAIIAVAVDPDTAVCLAAKGAEDSHGTAFAFAFGADARKSSAD